MMVYYATGQLGEELAFACAYPGAEPPTDRQPRALCGRRPSYPVQVNPMLVVKKPTRICPRCAKRLAERRP